MASRIATAVAVISFATLIGSGAAPPDGGTATPAAAPPFVSKVWVADNGDGTYKNPVLHADYSDPDVIRIGDDYYMVASSFACAPGIPVVWRQLLFPVALTHRFCNPSEVVAS